jgi:hypothetical protein
VAAVGGAQEVFEVLGLPALFARGELQLAAQHVGHRLEVDGTGHGAGLAGERGPAQRGGGHRLGGGHGEPGRHARTLVDGARLAQRTGEAGDDLPQVAGHLGDQLGLLVDQRDLVGQRQRVVRAHLGAEAVLERRDDPPAVGVVLRVGRRDEQDVQRQPQRVAAHLDVALLHHVEQRDLDPLGEVGQLVDGHDAPVGARARGRSGWSRGRRANALRRP